MRSQAVAVLKGVFHLHTAIVRRKVVRWAADVAKAEGTYRDDVAARARERLPWRLAEILFVDARANYENLLELFSVESEGIGNEEALRRLRKHASDMLTDKSFYAVYLPDGVDLNVDAAALERFLQGIARYPRVGLRFRTVTAPVVVLPETCSRCRLAGLLEKALASAGTITANAGSRHSPDATVAKPSYRWSA